MCGKNFRSLRKRAEMIKLLEEDVLRLVVIAQMSGLKIDGQARQTVEQKH